MVEAEFKKDMYGNYMVIKAQEGQELTYSLKMLLNNKIKGILNLDIHVADNKMEFQYDITSKQTIIAYVEHNQLGFEQLKTILMGIFFSIEQGKEFLLRENDFILTPEYIFIQSPNLEVDLCYFVGYSQDVNRQVSSLLEFLMNKVDYTDEKAVVMIYGLYKLSKENNSVLEQLKEFINKKPVIEEEIEVKKREDFQNNIKIPRMEEKIKEEKEILVHSPITICTGIFSLITVITLFVSLWRLKFLLDTTKTFGAVLILITGEAYLLSKLFSSKNKVSKIIEKTKYVDPVQPKEWEETYNIDIDEEEKTCLLMEEDMDKTMLLKEAVQGETFLLRAENPAQYHNIPIIEFPFFVGKLKSKVNYTINSTAISRFHAKIECIGNQYFITDLNSTNGTFVNNIRLKANETKELQENEKLSFANITFYFEKSDTYDIM